MRSGLPGDGALVHSIYLVLITTGLLAAGCQTGSQERNRAAEGAGRSGEALAETYCQSCHQLPVPNLLSKADWEQHVLPQMALFMGVYEDGARPDSLFEDGVAGTLVREAGIYPQEPMLAREQWEAIVAYFQEQAPATLPPAERPSAEGGLKHFAVHAYDARVSPPMTSLVQVDPSRSLIYVGDVKADYSTLAVLNRKGEVVQQLAPLKGPSHLERVEDTLFVLEAGRLLPTDAPSGRLVKLFRLPGQAQYGALAPVLDSLHRPVHFTRGDLNDDGRPDFVVSEFGRHVGRLAWFEALGDGRYQRHVLKDRPGATRSEIRDLNGDGRPDIVALMAQGDEGLFLFENKGDGRFVEQPLLRFPPSYGSTSFDLVDLNGDDHPDILYTAGDNGDYTPPLRKPYHGVRGFLNDGANRFEEAFFFPLRGAYGATTADFDHDGDLDIAAVAFYPGYSDAPGEGFVYLENTGDLRFLPYTFASQDDGRWMVVDRGDVDGDGDADLVLGSFVGLLEPHIPDAVQRRWLEQSPSFLVLENTTR